MVMRVRDRVLVEDIWGVQERNQFSTRAPRWVRETPAHRGPGVIRRALRLEKPEVQDLFDARGHLADRPGWKSVVVTFGSGAISGMVGPVSQVAAVIAALPAVVGLARMGIAYKDGRSAAARYVVDLINKTVADPAWDVARARQTLDIGPDWSPEEIKEKFQSLSRMTFDRPELEKLIQAYVVLCRQSTRK
jgi:hypothetical protein